MSYTKVTASMAKQEFRLTEEDLAKMKCEYRRNPHARFGPPMRLFSAKQVLKLGAIRLREHEQAKAAAAAAKQAKEEEKEKRREMREAKRMVREAEKRLADEQRELKKQERERVKQERERIKQEKANAPPKPRVTKKQKVADEEVAATIVPEETVDVPVQEQVVVVTENVAETEQTTTRAKRARTTPVKAVDAPAVAAPSSTPLSAPRYGTRSRTKQLQQQE